VANDGKVPRKYWWVVAVAVPVAVALISIVPGLFKPSGSGGGTTITGDNNTVNFDYSTHNTFVTNVNVIAREYELQTGRLLGDDLRRQIESAVNAAMQNNHTESIRLLEQVAQAAPVPAIYHNLGVEYAKMQNVNASRQAFELSKAKIADVAAAAANNRPLSATALKAPTVSGPGVRPTPATTDTASGASDSSSEHLSRSTHTRAASASFGSRSGGQGMSTWMLPSRSRRSVVTSASTSRRRVASTKRCWPRDGLLPLRGSPSRGRSTNTRCCRLRS